jgi:hypothetical protein
VTSYLSLQETAVLSLADTTAYFDECISSGAALPTDAGGYPPHYAWVYNIDGTLTCAMYIRFPCLHMLTLSLYEEITIEVQGVPALPPTPAVPELVWALPGLQCNVNLD